MLKYVSNETFDKCFFMVSKETFQNKRFINILKMFNLKRFFWDGFETKWNVSKTFHVCWVLILHCSKVKNTLNFPLFLEFGKNVSANSFQLHKECLFLQLQSYEILVNIWYGWLFTCYNVISNSPGWLCTN